jgi:hypothetical protein
MLPLPSIVRRNSFVLTVIALSFLCAVLAGRAKADVLGIPHTSRFDSASFPYARTVKGCTDWRRPASSALAKGGDQWGPVSFAGACQEHDRCFHTPGSTLSQCNVQFLTDLRASCARDLKQETLAKGQVGEPDAQALRLCHEIANMYFTRVQEPGVASRHAFAQKMALEYLRYVRGVVAEVYRDVLRRKPTDRELDKALAALRRDYSLDDLKSALMGAKMDGEAAPMPQLDAADALVSDKNPNDSE